MVIAADAGSAVSIASAVVAALVAILGVMGYQTRRARLSAIRTAFNDVVAALAADDPRQQLAAAVLLRRFFDPALQKLLADGLAYAPTLAGADLQRTNLQGAYPSSRHARGTLAKADFYRADLSGGSLKGARASGAVFYQARLRGTVLRDADLRGANFFEADLTGANFSGARLEGASFADARGIPPELESSLDAERRYTAAEPPPAPARARPSSQAVFLSLPASRTPAEEAICERIQTLLRREGLTVERLSREDYPPSDAMSEIYRRMSGCAGAVVFGLGSTSTEPSPGATPWTHLEAGMAYGCNLPLLMVRVPGVSSGAFDDAVAGHRTFMLDVAERWDDDAIARAIRPWLSELTRS